MCCLVSASLILRENWRPGAADNRAVYLRENLIKKQFSDNTSVLVSF